MKFCAVTCLLAFAVGAPAMTFIDFKTPGSGPVSGSYTYAGGAATFDATNIELTSISGRTDANPETTIACTGCLLNFQTGNATNAPGNVNETTFSSGGFFTITGSTGISGGSGVLVQGTFVGGTANNVSNNPTVGVIKTQNLFQINVINPALAAFFGQSLLGPFPVYAGTFEHTFETGTDVDQSDGFASTLLRNNGLNANVSTGQFVPEPSHVLLSGTAAGILALVIRRRRTV